MEYPIMFDSNEVGIASVTQQGMLALIQCRCSVADSLKYCIYVGQFPLGKCVPEGQLYTLTRRIPMGKLPSEPSFVMKEQETVGYTLREGEPILCLDKLSTARLVWCGEKAVLVFEDQISNSKNTGQ